MKRVIAILLSCTMLLTGCTFDQSGASMSEMAMPTVSTTIQETGHPTESTEALKDDTNEPAPITDTSEDAALDQADEAIDVDVMQDDDGYARYVEEQEFDSLNDSRFLQLVNDRVYSELELSLHSDDYTIDNVSSVYISKEYLDELAYNSKKNIYFGYTLDELEEQFQGTKFIFTLDDNGQTVVKEFEEYDDTFDRSLLRVAIGTGVILVCVTATVATGGTVSTIFAASAKTATTFALSSGVISGVSSGIITGIQTHDFDQALHAAAEHGSEDFMWGAISGAILGGAEKAYALHTAPTTSIEVPTWKESEAFVFDQFGGEQQVTYLAGEEVPYATLNGTRPDVVTQLANGEHVAIEVKNYDLVANKYNLKYVLKQQIKERVENLPSDMSQMIVLDARDRGYKKSYLLEVGKELQQYLYTVYPAIPIQIYTGQGGSYHVLNIAA